MVFVYDCAAARGTDRQRFPRSHFVESRLRGLGVLGMDEKEFLDKKLDIDMKDMAEAPPLGQGPAEIVHSALSESGQSH